MSQTTLSVTLVILASVLTLLLKIVYDWLKSNKSGSINPVCSEVFDQIQCSLDNSEMKFQRVEDKIDGYHNQIRESLKDVQSQFSIHGERIKALEVRTDIIDKVLPRASGAGL